MAEIGKDYSFDITKAEKIFDHLLKDGQLKLPKGHVIPSADEKKGRKFCKWHHSGSHTTNNCVVFRNKLQKAISDGRFKFPERGKMKVDEDPFLKMGINVAKLNLQSTNDRSRSGKAVQETIDQRNRVKEVLVVSKPEIQKAGSQQCMDVFSGSTMVAPSLSLKEVVHLCQNCFTQFEDEEVDELMAEILSSRPGDELAVERVVTERLNKRG